MEVIFYVLFFVFFSRFLDRFREGGFEGQVKGVPGELSLRDEGKGGAGNPRGARGRGPEGENLLGSLESCLCWVSGAFECLPVATLRNSSTNRLLAKAD